MSDTASIEKLMDGWERVTCVVCSSFYMRRDGQEHSDTCPPCERAQEQHDKFATERAHVLRNIERYRTQWLAKAGMQPRELTADLTRVPARIITALDRPSLGTQELTNNGAMPARGFGLSGDAGIGKTFALAAMFKQGVEARWRARLEHEGMRCMTRWLRWVRWPESVQQFRVTSMRDGGHERVNDIMADLQTCEALVIDDLGAERMRASNYGDDWVTSLLDLLVDHRYNAMLPTWWTCNIERDQFIKRYGARLYSRLTGGNDWVGIKPGTDLRQ